MLVRLQILTLTLPAIFGVARRVIRGSSSLVEDWQIARRRGAAAVVGTEAADRLGWEQAPRSVFMHARGRWEGGPSGHVSLWS